MFGPLILRLYPLMREISRLWAHFIYLSQMSVLELFTSDTFPLQVLIYPVCLYIYNFDLNFFLELVSQI